MGHDSAKLILIFCAAILCVAALLSIPERQLTSLYGKAQTSFRIITEADLPAQIESLEKEGRILAIRREASADNFNHSVREALRFLDDSRALFAQSTSGKKRVRILAPILDDNGSGLTLLSMPMALEAGEILDDHGRPLRWNTPYNVLASYSVPRPALFQNPEGKQENPRYSAALARMAPSGKAGDYRNLVDSFAKRYNLNSSLVMAIIHSESNFSPALVSNKSAMGLMQLLPSTASDEVHRFLYGKRGHVNYDQLSIPEINIRYGTAYLHILTNRYFADVKDPHIREACVIAAYNMGPNGFLKLYGATPVQAIERINSMSSDEFHADLPGRLPVRETRYYVEKVRRMKQHYTGMK